MHIFPVVKAGFHNALEEPVIVKPQLKLKFLLYLKKWEKHVLKEEEKKNKHYKPSNFTFPEPTSLFSR